MAYAANILQTLRAGTALASCRPVARSALHRSTRLCRRHYSEGENEKTEASQDTKKDGDDSGEVVTPEQKKLKEKEAEVVDLTSRLRYLQADFLNLQRNAAREKEQTRDFAITRFATDLLETADVLTLALKSVPVSVILPPESPSQPSEHSASSSDKPPEKTSLEYLRELHQGVEITQRQLLQTLFKYHVKPFDPTGERFDPNFHEALYQVPMPGKEPGSVIDCQKIGYTIKDRVLRAAQVGVAQETS